MTSLIVLGMMLMWCQTLRLVASISFIFDSDSFKMPSVNSVTVFYHMQNIKKLLKIPYSKSHVSMAVHRVGRTLLLDELDIQELFMSSSQVEQGFFQTFILLLLLCVWFKCSFSPCYVHVADGRLDMAERILPAANRPEVAEEKEE